MYKNNSMNQNHLFHQLHPKNKLCFVWKYLHFAHQMDQQGFHLIVYKIIIMW